MLFGRRFGYLFQLQETKSCENRRVDNMEFKEVLFYIVPAVMTYHNRRTMTETGKIRKRIVFWRKINSNIKSIGYTLFSVGILLFCLLFWDTIVAQDTIYQTTMTSKSSFQDLFYLTIPLLVVVFGFILIRLPKYYPSDLKEHGRKLNMEI